MKFPGLCPDKLDAVLFCTIIHNYLLVMLDKQLTNKCHNVQISCRQIMNNIQTVQSKQLYTIPKTKFLLLEELIYNIQFKRINTQ